MQLEFAVVCDYAGYLPNGKFVVVGPAVDSISSDCAAVPYSVSLAGSLRLSANDRTPHTLRIDATGPEKSRFTVTSEELLGGEIGPASAEARTQRNFAVQVGGVFQSPGDYLLHLVIDGEDAKTLRVHVSQTDSPQGEVRGPTLTEIEEIYQSELQGWIELEKMTPSDEVLQRIADRFKPPPEWIEEDDLFEPQPEPN